MILPLDIFTLIIDELVAEIPDICSPLRDPDDSITKVAEMTKVASSSAALKALSLTCKSLVPFCQRELFATVRFKSRPTAKVKWELITDLARILQQSPHLSAYIRNVYFADDRRDLPKSELISSVLEKLRDVRVLDLDEACYSSGGSWGQIPERIVSALEDIVKLPSLRILRISLIQGIPLDFVRGASQLQRLMLCRCSLLGFCIDPIAPSGPFVTRSSAGHIDRADSSIVQPIIEFAALKTLAVDVNSKKEAKVLQELVKFTGNLNHLRWTTSKCIRSLTCYLDYLMITQYKRIVHLPAYPRSCLQGYPKH
jgi:hypothetical protein